MTAKTDQWSFLWNLSNKLRKAEVKNLLKYSVPLFRGRQVCRWSCFELFENLVESKKVKFTSERRAVDWCILKEWLEKIQRKDLAKELDDFGFNDMFEKMKERSPPCYVVEYFPCKDLKKSSITDTCLLIKYAKQIVCGLKYLHANNVLHCNLKAENILIAAENNIKISGLSSARRIKENQDILLLDENVKLPIKWMPLEVVFYRRFCKASDVWSFRIVLVEMFNGGEIPYKDMSNEETIRFLSDGRRHKKPEKCPDALYRSLMLKCWLLDPKERPLLDAISSILDSYSTDQKIQDILPQIVADLKNRKSIYITEVKQRFVKRFSSVSFLDFISPENLTLTQEILGEGFHSVVFKAERVSLRWTAPEVLASKIHRPKSDVWSYGILMVELFSFGECPYKEWNHQELEPKVLGGFRHSQPTRCPDIVYELMTKCWRMEPRERPSFGDISKELGPIAQKLKNG